MGGRLLPVNCDAGGINIAIVEGLNGVEENCGVHETQWITQLLLHSTWTNLF